jgi:hypothetical protein
VDGEETRRLEKANFDCRFNYFFNTGTFNAAEEVAAVLSGLIIWE